MKRATGNGAVALGLLVLGGMSLSGCIVYGHDRPSKGDIKLRWSFAGETDCVYAGVDDVVVTIDGRSNGEHFEAVISCPEGGGLFTNFIEGRYAVTLEGLNVAGEIAYAVTENAYVSGGTVENMGMVDLLPLGPLPPETGSLSVDWSFMYPQNTATLNCAFAGVEYVRVIVSDAISAVVFDQSIRCIDGPATIDYFDPGQYTVELYGIGQYRGHSIELYGAQPFGIDILAGQLTVIDTPVALYRYEEEFGDIQVSWSFGGNNSCSAVGVSSVTIDVTRLGATEPEATATVACSDEPQLFSTFVPADYRVEVSAPGDWYGYLDIGLGPNSLADVTIQMN
ncbi:MAG: hypothetical protein JXR83_01820 [Deltaproteobacteria bacterium]|nr:hypothetical protein [Deltaproteobacteria bacterium]